MKSGSEEKKRQTGETITKRHHDLDTPTVLLDTYLAGLGKDIRITDIRDGHHGDAEIFTASGSESDIVSVEMMHRSLRKHSVVFDLRFSQLGTVVGNKNEFGC